MSKKNRNNKPDEEHFMKDNAEFIYNTKNITLRKYSNRHLDIILDK